MSKAEAAREAANEVRQTLLSSGLTVRNLMAQVAPEYGVEPRAIESWLLRDPEIPSLDDLDQLVFAERARIEEMSRRRDIERLESERRHADLADIIDKIAPSALFFASLNAVNFPPSQIWRRWIAENASETQDQNDDAFAFAHKRLKSRIESSKV